MDFFSSVYNFIVNSCKTMQQGGHQLTPCHIREYTKRMPKIKEDADDCMDFSEHILFGLPILKCSLALEIAFFHYPVIQF